jgi:molecular chaperone GrpE
MKKVSLKKISDKEANLLKSQLARALADYDNLRKRVERERETFEKIASLKLVLKLLPVLDTLRKAQTHLKDSGLDITIKEFEEALALEGIEEIKAKKGEAYNSELHEVIDTVIDSKNEGKIAEMEESGWKFINGPVIRYAKVRVYQKGAN